MNHPFRVFRTGTELRFWHLSPLILANLAHNLSCFAFRIGECKCLIVSTIGTV
jgi:hypothetical protein